MGPEIIIPVVLLAIVIPAGFTWAKRNLRDPAKGGSALGEPVAPPSGRLTSGALRELAAPPWRVIYEIADDKLGGVEHVLIGPAGIFAMKTSMEPTPTAPEPDPAPTEVAKSAIMRAELDEALRRCALSSDRLVWVHWGTGDGPVSCEVLPQTTAVDGRRIAEWANGLPEALSAAQVDLAWQTLTTAIGRPDPLG